MDDILDRGGVVIGIGQGHAHRKDVLTRLDDAMDGDSIG